MKLLEESRNANKRTQLDFGLPDKEQSAEAYIFILGINDPSFMIDRVSEKVIETFQPLVQQSDMKLKLLQMNPVLKCLRTYQSHEEVFIDSHSSWKRIITA